MRLARSASAGQLGAEREHGVEVEQRDRAAGVSHLPGDEGRRLPAEGDERLLRRLAIDGHHTLDFLGDQSDGDARARADDKAAGAPQGCLRRGEQGSQIDDCEHASAPVGNPGEREAGGATKVTQFFPNGIAPFVTEDVFPNPMST